MNDNSCFLLKPRSDEEDYYAAVVRDELNKKEKDAGREARRWGRGGRKKYNRMTERWEEKYKGKCGRMGEDGVKERKMEG